MWAAISLPSQPVHSLHSGCREFYQYTNLITAVTCSKPLCVIYCPQEVGTPQHGLHSSHDQASLSACLLSGLQILFLSLSSSLHPESFYVLLPYLQPQNPCMTKYCYSFISYLKHHLRAVFPNPKPGQIPQHSGLHHLQT